MKQHLNREDKISIIKGLKNNEFRIYELNHLTKHIHDHTRAIELVPDFVVTITPADKKSLLKAIKTGVIDFDKIPDLKKEIEVTMFMRMLQAAGE